MRRRFQQVDVFGVDAGTGNPVAVVLDGSGLSDDAMRQFSQWTNLSETTFVLPPDDAGADYRVRIFSLTTELPFAGHPTLGTCHAWLSSGGQPKQPGRVVQECQAGLISIVRADRLALAAPARGPHGPVDERDTDRILDVLKLQPDEVIDMAWVDNGPGWVAVLLHDATAVLAVEPRHAQPPTLSSGSFYVGIVGAYAHHAPCAFELRALFADSSGVLREDPVTGSLNASVAQWLLESGRATPPYVASQGTRIGRHGHIFIDVDGTQVWVGGRTTTMIDGTVTLDGD